VHASAEASRPLLVVDRLEVRYGRVAALRGVSFSVGAGEVVGLVGPNGAGKTTSLAAVTGLVSPGAGTVTFDGDRVDGHAPEHIVRRGVALVPEGRHIFGTLSVAENLRMGATVRRPGPELDGDIEQELSRFPALRRYFRSPAGRLSGGEQQQLAIARALLSRPRLLLLDEPSLGLAPLMVDLVFDTLAELRDDGMTILLVEQNANQTIDFADRTYVLRSGQVATEGTRDELIATADLAELYLGERQ
jgi:branched-chain amino acid transport system ATP-binding protein